MNRSVSIDTFSSQARSGQALHCLTPPHLTVMLITICPSDTSAPRADNVVD